jgi:protein O-GlcNAc transferase
MAELTILQAIEAALEHHRAGRLNQAEAIYRKILAVEPRQPDALHLLGYLAYQVGKHDPAIELIGRAVQLDPDNGNFQHSLGNALAARGLLDQAIAHLTRAVELCPKDFAMVNNLANCLASAGRREESAQRFEQLLALKPDLAEGHNNYSIVLKDLGRIGQAVEHARRASELNGNLSKIWNTFALALHSNGRYNEAIDALRQALVVQPDYIRAHSNLLLMLHYTTMDPAALLAEHLAWAQRHVPGHERVPRPPVREPRDPERVLRIGYVSGDFHEHVVSYFLRPILAQHDRTRFEIFAYSDTIHPDAATAAMASCVHTWRSIVGVSDDAVAQLIRDDGIDILVDLCGHTHGERLPIFVRRPAPIQVTYLGYPDTTGLTTIDYRLTDSFADPPGLTERWHTEKLIRLPHSAWCYPIPGDLPEVQDAPSVVGEHVTFGSLNALAKLSDMTLDLWAKILAATPNSRLLIKAIGLEDADTREHLATRLVERGVLRDRFDLLGKTRLNIEHLTTYHRLDIALDTFPYHGTTTTLEALYMGVPVVSLAGQTHCSRIGASLLTNVGLGELVAESGEQYVAIAAAVAGVPERLLALRQGLRDRVAASPICNAPEFVRDLESLYRQMWRQFL